MNREPHKKISKFDAWWAAQKLIWSALGRDYQQWWQGRITAMWLYLLIWVGGKLFSIADVYIPDGENGDVKAISFAVDEEAFLGSCRSTLEDQGD